MKITPFLEILRQQRSGKREGISRAPRERPGTEIREIDGVPVLCYDGNGPSGYTGPVSTSAPSKHPRSKPSRKSGVVAPGKLRTKRRQKAGRR